MPATLGQDLVSDLVGVADEIRGEIYPALGVCQHRVYVERWKWPGDERGEGTPVLVSSTEITPRPIVDERGLLRPLHEGGRQDEGDIRLSGISLTMTEAEITGGRLDGNESWLWKLVDTGGQGIQDRYYVLKDPAKAKRLALGWDVVLHRVEAP
jgi:hypothetical protein